MKKVYADVTIKISRIDRVLNFLINEAARENIGWTRIGFWVSLDCKLWYFRFGMYWDISYTCFQSDLCLAVSAGLCRFIA